MQGPAVLCLQDAIDFVLPVLPGPCCQCCAVLCCAVLCCAACVNQSRGSNEHCGAEVCNLCSVVHSKKVIVGLLLGDNIALATRGVCLHQNTPLAVK